MSNATKITISKRYGISAIRFDGTRAFYDTDEHSGGWPYWSPVLNQHKTWPTLDQVPTIKGEDYLRREVTSIEIIEVTISAKVVQTTEIVSEARAKAEAEIAKIKKDLAHKIALLEGVK
jgi:hypothetical protein